MNRKYNDVSHEKENSRDKYLNAETGGSKIRSYLREVKSRTPKEINRN